MSNFTSIHYTSITKGRDALFEARYHYSRLLVVQSLSCVQLFATPWTVDCQAPLSMRFFQARILEWVAISFFRGIFPDQGWNPPPLHWQADSLPRSHQGSPQIIIFLWKSVNSLEKDTLRMYKQPIYLQTLTLSTDFKFLFSTIITVVSQ